MRAASLTPDTSHLTPAPTRRIVIEPPRGCSRSIWPRSGVTAISWRCSSGGDFSARYRQSILGVGWAIVRPVLSVLVFTVIFGMVAKLPSDGIPYPLFSFAAMMPWLYFSTALTNATNSVVLGQDLLTKVYFPRLVLPLASIVGGLGDLAIQFVLLVGLMFWYGVVPTWTVLLVPLFIVECMVVSLALGLWLTALNVKYRDIGQARAVRGPDLDVPDARSSTPAAWSLRSFAPCTASIRWSAWSTVSAGRCWADRRPTGTCWPSRRPSILVLLSPASTTSAASSRTSRTSSNVVL